MRFFDKVNRRQPPIERKANPIVSEIVLSIETTEGRRIAEKRIEVGSKSQTKTMNWSIDSRLASFELGADNQPLLFAYGLEVLPMAPNPNEDLVWE